MSASSQPPSATISSEEEALSPSSSPPLILAFLAIGLFSAAVVFVFWRRIQGNRGGWRLTTTPLDNNNDHSFYFNLPIVNIDVPKLWDLSNGGNFARGGQGNKERGLSSDVIWDNLMVHIVPRGFHYETKKPFLDEITYPSLYLYIKK